LQRGDLASFHGNTVLSGLLRQAAQQFRPRDTRESWHVVALRNPRCSTGAAVHDAEPAAVTGKIDSSSEAGRASANDKTIKHS
jgi:hypothetical protein